MRADAPLLAALRLGRDRADDDQLPLREPRRKASVYNAFEVVIRATSLGDVASLVDSFDNPDLLRISVGIEDAGDLAADLTAALDRAI